MQNNNKIFYIDISDNEEFIMQKSRAGFLGVITIGLFILLFVVVWLF